MLAELERLPAWTVVALDYELGYLLEPRSAPPGWQPDGRPLARFWRFHECRQLDGAAAEAWLADQAPGLPAGVGGWRETLDAAAYHVAVDRIQSLIAAGDCYQVNFTFPVDFDWFGTPIDLYARLRQRQPVRYGGFVGDAGAGIVSLSPELFVERRGDRLRTRPMKGTAPLAEPPQALRDSVKDRAENLMIVDLLRNDLGRVAAGGSVRVDRLFDIEDYPTVRQMVSEISAEVPGRRFAEILAALFPCGSITGAPKIRAMQIIGELEPAARGIYTGAFGWLAPDGDFRLNVAIRTLALEAGGRGRMGVGSGIVADSQAAAEWAECRLKSGFLRGCEPGLRLIETLRREGGIYPMWAGHLARLRRSAEWFGFALDEQALCRELAGQPASGAWRVRLTLGRDGDLEVASFPLEATPPTRQQALLAATRIAADDPLRRHKTTARADYDAALRDLPAGCFDAIFLNQRGEVAEGARSNVFVERDGVLLTPPVSSGALPGVLRASLLASGRAREAVLSPADLADGFWLGNALRGLVPVDLRPDGEI
ncbi:aminodeoxychorismate synthase component I [Azonexus fungiphilus]|uniref:aminodeoxychorismate synthase component I n=1 Tax=Azonexus fungiphilus TaxID=146940 RepID=UPI00156A7A4A|nr:aminodeoxychorismate synthase component I [Azonexus fungiphilus]